MYWWKRLKKWKYFQPSERWHQHKCSFREQVVAAAEMETSFAAPLMIAFTPKWRFRQIIRQMESRPLAIKDQSIFALAARMNSPFPSQTAAVDPIRRTKCRLRAANWHNIDCLNKETLCGTGRTLKNSLGRLCVCERECAHYTFLSVWESCHCVCLSSAHTTQKESAKLTQKRNLRRLHHRERAIIKELPQLAAAGILAAAKSHFSFSNSHIKKCCHFGCADLWAPIGSKKCKSLY